MDPKARFNKTISGTVRLSTQAEKVHQRVEKGPKAKISGVQIPNPGFNQQSTKIEGCHQMEQLREG